MKKLDKKQKLQKKLENVNFWRHCYIIPPMILALLSSLATTISFLVGAFTGSFLFTEISVIPTIALIATTIANYNLQDQIDIKFMKKIIKLEKRIKDLTEDASTEIEVENTKQEDFSGYLLEKGKERNKVKLANPIDVTEEVKEENQLDV